ncbi:MAG: hypothetical protein ACT4OE_07160 [Sphingosinicella sp.]
MSNARVFLTWSGAFFFLPKMTKVTLANARKLTLAARILVEAAPRSIEQRLPSRNSAPVCQPRGKIMRPLSLAAALLLAAAPVERRRYCPPGSA